MAPPPGHFVPDSSVKALILERRSSSSPASSIDSPTAEPCLPPSSPSEPSRQVRNPHASSLASPSSVVPEILPTDEHEGSLRQRQKGKKKDSSGKHKENVNIDPSSKERKDKEKLQRGGSAELEKKKKGWQDNLCCKCMAGFTADCAAVCCCPLALLHLAALTFIRLPTAVAWKALVKLKNKLFTKRGSPRADEDDSPRPNPNNRWSRGSSPEAKLDIANRRASFDNQNVWQQFEERRLDFGGLSMRREPQ